MELLDDLGYCSYAAALGWHRCLSTPFKRRFYSFKLPKTFQDNAISGVHLERAVQERARISLFKRGGLVELVGGRRACIVLTG